MGSYHQSGNIYHKRSRFRGTKDYTGMYYLLRHNITALICTKQHDVTPTPTVSRNGIFNASLIGDASMTMFPDGRTTRAVPQLPGFHGAATKEAFLETHLMNIYVEALLKTGCVRANHKNTPNISKYVHANFAT